MFASCFWNLLLGRRTSKLSDWRLSSWWPELCWWWVASEAAALNVWQDDSKWFDVWTSKGKRKQWTVWWCLFFEGCPRLCGSLRLHFSLCFLWWFFNPLSRLASNINNHWIIHTTTVCVCVWGNHRDWNALEETLILNVLWVFLSVLSCSDSTSRCSSYQSWMWLHMITNHSSNTHMACSTSVSFG